MPCPTPEKLWFRNQRDAIERAFQDSMEYERDLRPYRCPCGRWHLTTHHRKSWKGTPERRKELRDKREHRKRRIALNKIARALAVEVDRRKNVTGW